MSNDLFKSVNFTAGQEVRAHDLNDAQKFLVSKLVDQLIDFLTPGEITNAGLAMDRDPEFRSRIGANSSQLWAYTLSPGQANATNSSSPFNRVRLAPGTLFQKVKNSDGDEASILAYTFDGTDTFTINNGNGSNPRVDLIQMKLELESTDSTARVYKTQAVEAELNADAGATNFNTIFAARVPGQAGNNIRLRCEPGGAGVTVIESGWLVTIEYEDGVSTVADVEAAIDADSQLIVVKTAGTGANVLSDPDDTFGPALFSGGVDSVLTSQTVNTKRRVKATVNLKAGTPAAHPTLPEPDEDFVPLFGVLVCHGYDGSDSPRTLTSSIDDVSIDPSSNFAFIVDLRMPLCLRKYVVRARDFDFTTDWVAAPDNAPSIGRFVECTSTTTDRGLKIVCPTTTGRLVAIGMVSSGDGDNAILNTLSEPSGYSEGLADVSSLVDGSVGERVVMGRDLLEAGDASWLIQPNANYGAPIWCNGLRGPNEDVRQDHDWFNLVLEVKSTDPLKVKQVVFYVAEGL